MKPEDLKDICDYIKTGDLKLKGIAVGKVVKTQIDSKEFLIITVKLFEKIESKKSEFGV